MKRTIRYFVFLPLMLCGFGAFATTFKLINVPVATMYKSASQNSETISSAIYGSRVKIINTRRNWSKVETDDGYQGWVKSRNLINQYRLDGNYKAKVTNLFARIYRASSLHQKPIMSVAFGTMLSVSKTEDPRWDKVYLLNGKQYWIRSGTLKLNPKNLTLKQMVALTRKFVGLPYTWGGVSTFGFDCSGFVQFMFRQMGIVLPRNGVDQAAWPGFIKVSKNDLKPGDAMYFGYNKVISHAGIYIGNGKFADITMFNTSDLQISDFSNPHWQKLFIAARRLKTNLANIQPLSASMMKKMQQYTWHKGCPVALQDLSALRVTYYGFDKKTHVGTLVVNRKFAPEISELFAALYQHKFPIESIKPMYEFRGNDDASMKADNSSAFNCREMTDFPNQFSIHSYGAAIDINPLINPYVFGDKVSPVEGKKYLDRASYHKGKITKDSFIVKEFARYGWDWGGSWPKGHPQDYQHFEKTSFVRGDL
ncbi:MAG: C40 family peptidase [Gammaproteobacteria bacterium]|nr:C40 family peptidase [Gammaproteobacteria bacterium]